jgi:hypothetical protein
MFALVRRAAKTGSSPLKRSAKESFRMLSALSFFVPSAHSRARASGYQACSPAVDAAAPRITLTKPFVAPREAPSTPRTTPVSLRRNSIDDAFESYKLRKAILDAPLEPGREARLVFRCEPASKSFNDCVVTVTRAVGSARAKIETSSLGLEIEITPDETVNTSPMPKLINQDQRIHDLLVEVAKVCADPKRRVECREDRLPKLTWRQQ